MGLRLLPLPALAAFLLSACSGFGLRGDAGYANLDLNGNMALAPSAGGVNLGTIKVDLSDNLGIADTFGSPYARVEAGLGIASVTASALAFDKSAGGTLNASFGDISAGTAVRTDIQLKNVKGAVHFDLLNLFGLVRVSPGVGVDLMAINMDVSATAVPGLSETIDAVVPVPILFLQGEVDLGSISAIADVGGVKADLKKLSPDQTGDVTFWDAEALVRWNPTANFELFAGYRWVHVDGIGRVQNQDFAADLDLKGWLLGGGISF